MRRRFPLLLALAAALLMLPAANGCGNTKGTISPDQYAQLAKDMTFEGVEGIVGTPERTHRMASGETVTTYWYYEKTDGEGLVKITFENGIVTSISPYDLSLSPEEY